MLLGGVGVCVCARVTKSCFGSVIHMHMVLAVFLAGSTLKKLNMKKEREREKDK